MLKHQLIADLQFKQADQLYLASRFSVRPVATCRRQQGKQA